MRIEFAQIVERIELMDHLGGIGSCDHVQLVDMVNEQVLPQLVLRNGQIPFAMDNLGHMSRKRLVEKRVPEHDLRVSAANSRTHDATPTAQMHAPLIRHVLRVLRRVIGAVNVRFEGTLDKVVVRRTDVGAFEPVKHDHKGRVVIPRRVMFVHDDIDAEKLLKIEEVLLLVTNDDGNVIDASFLELANLTLDEDLIADAQETLWLFVGDRSKARREAGRENDRVIDSIRLERCVALLRHLQACRACLLQVPPPDKLAHRSIHRSHGKPRMLSN